MLISLETKVYLVEVMLLPFKLIAPDTMKSCVVLIRTNYHMKDLTPLAYLQFLKQAFQVPKHLTSEYCLNVFLHYFVLIRFPIKFVLSTTHQLPTTKLGALEYYPNLI